MFFPFSTAGVTTSRKQTTPLSALEALTAEAKELSAHLEATLSLAARDAERIHGLKKYLTDQAEALGGSGDPRSLAVYRLLEAVPAMPVSADMLLVSDDAIDHARADWARRAAELAK